MFKLGKEEEKFFLKNIFNRIESPKEVLEGCLFPFQEYGEGKSRRTITMTVTFV